MCSWGYPKYVSAAERQKKAEKKVAQLKKQGKLLNPISINGLTIAKTFWGKAWCKHLESYADHENRLSRGRTYARNGSILDLVVAKGEITALVNGSHLYNVSIKIAPLTAAAWKKVVTQCAGKIESLLGLLQGKLPQTIIEYIIDKDKGLFPDITQITMSCSCFDYATMCKHVAAVLYGVGARLDHNPESLFVLRHVNHLELLQTNDSITQLTQSKDTINELASGTDLADLFGIDLEQAPQPKAKNKKTAKITTKAAEKKIATKKKSVAKKKRAPEKKPAKTSRKKNS